MMLWGPVVVSCAPSTGCDQVTPPFRDTIRPFWVVKYSRISGLSGVIRPGRIKLAEVAAVSVLLVVLAGAAAVAGGPARN